METHKYSLYVCQCILQSNINPGTYTKLYECMLACVLVHVFMCTCMWFIKCNLAFVSVDVCICAVWMHVVYTFSPSQRSLMENRVVIGLAVQVVL